MQVMFSRQSHWCWSMQFRDSVWLAANFQDSCEQTQYHTPTLLMLTIWWRHQMKIFSALLDIVRGIHRSPVNSPHKGQWRSALMFSLICVWINGGVNNREAGELRCHRAHYDATLMHQAAKIVKGIKNGWPCIVEIRGTQGCALVGDPARAVGECRDVAKAQPCVPLISTMHGQPFLIPFITWNIK